jgi:type IV secretion system protein VirB1
MTPIEFMTLAQQCAPQVAPATLAAIVRTESRFNPYAIGVVHGQLVRQPRSQVEAIATAQDLERHGWNYSVGLAQVNRWNFARYGLTPGTAFDSCRNLAAGAAILNACYQAAQGETAQVQQALKASLSCYASGDFVTGYRTGYVQRVVENAAIRSIPTVSAVPMVPAIAPEVTPIPVVPVSRRGPSTNRVVGRSDRTNDPGDGGRSELPDSSAVVF